MAKVRKVLGGIGGILSQNFQCTILIFVMFVPAGSGVLSRIRSGGSCISLKSAQGFHLETFEGNKTFQETSMERNKSTKAESVKSSNLL